jgi:hypothetical protein
MQPSQMYPNLMSAAGPTSTAASQPPVGGAMPQDPSGQEKASPQEIKELQDFIKMIEGEMQKADAVRQAGTMADFNARKQMLGEIFNEIAKQGVDLTNQQSVAMFLTKLQSTNPDIASGFVMAIEHLIQESPSGGQGTFAPHPPQQQAASASPGGLNPQQIKEIKSVKTHNIPQRALLIQSPPENPWTSPASSY